MNGDVLSSLSGRDRRIVSAVLRRMESHCPGAVSLIGVTGSAYTGDADSRSDLDLLIVPADERAETLARAFLIGEIGFDIYCTPWKSLERMAQYTSPYAGKLLDLGEIYWRSPEDRAHYRTLQNQLKDTLAAPFVLDDLTRCEALLREAESAYAGLMTARSAGDSRFYALEMTTHLEHSLFLRNKAVIRRGVRHLSEELALLPELPDGFSDARGAVVSAPGLEALRECSTVLLRLTRDYFAALREELARGRTFPEPVGTFEEAVSNFRGKFQRSAESGDVYSSMMAAAGARAYFQEMHEIFGTGVPDLMRHMSPGDLAGNARAFDEALAEYRGVYERGGFSVRRYENLEEFEADYPL